jgi:hypothetical protein
MIGEIRGRMHSFYPTSLAPDSSHEAQSAFHDRMVAVATKMQRLHESSPLYSGGGLLDYTFLLCNNGGC